MSSNAAPTLDALPTLTATWDLPDVDEGVADWEAFIVAQEGTFTPPDDLPQLLASMEKLRASGATPTKVRDIVLQRLATVSNEGFERAGKDQRVRRLLMRDGEPVSESQWVVLSDPERTALHQSGAARFAPTPGMALLLALSTLPLAVAIFAFAYVGFRDERVDLLVAAGLTYVLWFLARRALRKRGYLNAG